MRYHEIITETPGDTWEQRYARHQRQQAKRTKLRAQLQDVEAKAADQQRSAAAKRSRMHSRITAIRRDLAGTAKPE